MTDMEYAELLAGRPKSRLHHLSANGVTPISEAADRAIEQARVFTPETPRLSEHEEQCALIRWRDDNAASFPGLRLLHAIPNGGPRSKAAAGKLRAEGALAGVPDLFLPVARRAPDGREYHGLYIEMKAIGGQASSAQVDFMSAVRVNGYCAAMCFGWEAAIKTICWYYGEAR